jgi:hypothetical protein
MELVMCLPAVVILIISLPLDQVFKAIVPHLTVQDLFDCTLLFAINEHWQWRRGSSTAWDQVWKSDGEFDHRKDRMEPLKLKR